MLLHLDLNGGNLTDNLSRIWFRTLGPLNSRSPVAIHFLLQQSSVFVYFLVCFWESEDD